MVIYLLIVYSYWQKRIVNRDDPFSNATLLSFLLFCIVIQKYIVIYIFEQTVTEPAGLTEAESTAFWEEQAINIQIVLKTLMSLEVLFTIIPFRHNFSLEHVETE